MVLYDVESMYNDEMDRKLLHAEANADSDKELSTVEEEYINDRLGRDIPDTNYDNR